ncbi:MAG TPA: Hsp33 family molecular chaperone HslO [Candidatus Syntrophosphaera thermopropionivorans]|nr:Hsp33 family molecular chaperone HslO [Candidatus Syntrophosphaera thermopropionivorans]
MKESDYLWRGMALNGQFRVLAVSSTNTVQAARDLHDLSPINTILMGKMIPAVAMLSLDLKDEGAEVTLRFDGDGPLKGALTICNNQGDVRGYAFEPKFWLDDLQENFHPVKYLGNGTLTVIRYYLGDRPTKGLTPLIEGDVAQNLAYYFEQSEQIPTAVNLGVLIDKDAKVRASGGFIIQQLPSADRLNADRLIDNINHMPNLSDLMDMGMYLPEILHSFVFKEGGLELYPVHRVRYRCHCSKERFAAALKLLSLDELKELRDGIDPVCQFCNATWHFSAAEIEEIISEVEKK